MEIFKFGKTISTINRYLHDYISKKLKNKGITGGLIPFIMEIYKKENITQKNLSCTLKVDKTTTAKAIKKLINLGYVISIKDDSDKRICMLKLTETGKKLVTEIKKNLDEVNHALMDSFSPDELVIIENMLLQMQLNIIKLNGGN